MKKEKIRAEITWYSQAARLLHNANRASFISFFFASRDQNFNGAFAGEVVKMERSPFITTNSEFSAIFGTWKYLIVPPLKPFFSSSPVKPVLRQCNSSMATIKLNINTSTRTHARKTYWFRARVRQNRNDTVPMAGDFSENGAAGGGIAGPPLGGVKPVAFVLDAAAINRR